MEARRRGREKERKKSRKKQGKKQGTVETISIIAYHVVRTRHRVKFQSALVRAEIPRRLAGFCASRVQVQDSSSPRPDGKHKVLPQRRHDGLPDTRLKLSLWRKLHTNESSIGKYKTEYSRQRENVNTKQTRKETAGAPGDTKNNEKSKASADLLTKEHVLSQDVATMRSASKHCRVGFSNLHLLAK